MKAVSDIRTFVYLDGAKTIFGGYNMRDHQENQKEREETKEKKKRISVKEKQAWIGLASACAAIVLAVVLIIAFAGRTQPSIDAGNMWKSYVSLPIRIILCNALKLLQKT